MGTQCPVPGLPYQVRNRMVERRKSQADILGSGDSSHGGVVYLPFNQFREGRSIKSWGKKCRLCEKPQRRKCMELASKLRNTLLSCKRILCTRDGPVKYKTKVDNHV